MAKEEHAEQPVARLERHVALVGLMGAGKSAIGKRVATAIGAPFLDADREIECAAGMTIADIFEAHGESAFRDGERRVIARLLDGPPLILATGGGAYMDESTRGLLAKKATTIWMRADLDVLVRRCARRTNRPILRNGDPREILGELIQVRYPVYAQADIEIFSRDEPHKIAVDEIVRRLQERGDLAWVE